MGTLGHGREATRAAGPAGAGRHRHRRMLTGAVGLGWEFSADFAPRAQAGRAGDHGTAGPPLLTAAGKPLPLGLGCCDSLKGQPAPAPGAACAAKPQHQEG